jgi:small subunit ribosomal protein S5
VYIKPAKGSSLIAGSSVRNVLELAGVRSANAKVISKSKNKINNARAALKALSRIAVS